MSGAVDGAVLGFSGVVFLAFFITTYSSSSGFIA
jgi:hypothetical protein